MPILILGENGPVKLSVEIDKDWKDTDFIAFLGNFIENFTICFSEVLNKSLEAQTTAPLISFNEDIAKSAKKIVAH